MKLRNVLLLAGLPLGLTFLGLTIPYADAQTETVLHHFTGHISDGQHPLGTLVEGDDGNLYGTTYTGGKTNSYLGCGTVFWISPSGTYTTLYFFGTSPSDGCQPIGGLVKGTDGNFYGTTERGGTNGIGSGGLGTIFRISPGGSFTNLWSFPGYLGDGYFPQAALVQGTDGSFYGTTYAGGTNGYGTVFQMSPEGAEKTLCDFPVWLANGFSPVPGVVPGKDGNLYGTMVNGGTNTGCFAGCGAVFRIEPSGSFTILHSFVGYPSDGANPYAGLVEGSDGNFYGTTRIGGINDCGTVFRISPSGSETLLYSFGSSPNDGCNPQAALLQGSDGNFYGATIYAGATGAGIVFRTSPTGEYTNLYSFQGAPGDGYQPNTAALIQGIDGNLYGTTPGGGSNNLGTVFKLTVPLTPPANQIAGLQFLSVFDMSYAAILIPSVANETYQLQYSDSMNPTSWINSGDPLTSIGGPVTFFDFVGSTISQRFYRFAITP